MSKAIDRSWSQTPFYGNINKVINFIGDLAKRAAVHIPLIQAACDQIPGIACAMCAAAITTGIATAKIFEKFSSDKRTQLAPALVGIFTPLALAVVLNRKFKINKFILGGATLTATTCICIFNATIAIIYYTFRN